MKFAQSWHHQVFGPDQDQQRPLTDIETDDEMDEPDDAEPWTKNIGLPAHPTGLKRTMSDPSIGHVDKAARE